MFRSLNFKIFIVAVALMLLLIVLIFKAATIRQRRIEWLRDLNRQIGPMEDEKGEEPSGWDTGIQTVQPVTEGMEELEKRGDENLAYDELSRILDSFNKYEPAGRAESEARIYKYFESLVQSATENKQAGDTGEVLQGYESFFGKLEALGYPYEFEDTKEKKRFVDSLMSGWPRFSYMGRWATIKMLGIVGGPRAHEVLRNAVKEGVIGDEAVIALLRTGDEDTIPPLLDYISRGRIGGVRYLEVVRMLVDRGNRAVLNDLIAQLGNKNRGIRVAALGLLERLAVLSEGTPKGISPDDSDLQRKWEKWWQSAQSEYEFPKMKEEGITALTLVAGVDSLPEQGDLGQSYFAKLRRDIEECCSALKMMDLKSHKKGETALYSIARQMVKDYERSNGEVREVVKQYMDIFADEVERICVRQRFGQSPERTEFARWATDELSKGDMPVVFLLAGVLGIAGDKETTGALHPYAESWIPEIRRAAIFSLGKLGSPEVTGEIGDILLDEKTSLADGEKGVAILEQLGTDEAKEVLIETLRSATPLIAYEAYLSLRRLYGEPGKALSLEEVEQGRKALAESYGARRVKD
jgi:hypothetical protein